MSRALKRIDINKPAWKSGVTTSSITVILKGSDDGATWTYDPPVDKTAKHPIDNVGNYDSNGMPYFEDYPYDHEGYKDRFTYIGDYVLNGVTYNKWDGPGGTNNIFYLTNVVVEKAGVQVESANCDGNGSIIEDKYIKKSSLSSSSFVTSGRYDQLTGAKNLYLHKVTITLRDSSNNYAHAYCDIIDTSSSASTPSWDSVKKRLLDRYVEWNIYQGPAASNDVKVGFLTCYTSPSSVYIRIITRSYNEAWFYVSYTPTVSIAAGTLLVPAGTLL